MRWKSIRSNSTGTLPREHNCGKLMSVSVRWKGSRMQGKGTGAEEMGIINNKDVYGVIRKTLNMIDSRLMDHGEMVGYILYRMMQAENKYSLQELIDYTMIGILHDIGIYKESSKNFLELETKNVWKHSIYGYLFLRYLSPVEEKAEIVLYHHLNYNKYPLIHSEYMDIVELLNFADKVDLYLRVKSESMDSEYFVKNRGIVYSSKAQDTFLLAEKKYKVLESISNGDYLEELNDILSKKLFTEEYKRGFLQMLVYTIDFRSETTVLHTLAATTIATELGRLLRVSSQDIYLIYYGALLHDIGKLVIPVEILEAPRKLTEEEMEIMKAHVKNTETILRGVINDEVVDIAVRHHERMDGSGYPNGLTGSQLTLPQRIVAVADVISALYQKRSYKNALDGETIKALIQEEADQNKLCPIVTACAVRNFQQIMKNFEKQREQIMGTYLEILNQYETIYEKFKVFEEV